MGEGVGAQPKPPCGRFLRPSAAAAAPPPGAAPRSLPLLHTRPGGRRQAANQQKKQGGEGAAFPAEGARQRARASGRRPPSPISLSLHTSPAQTSSRYHQILPNPPPSPGKIPPRPRKKRRPHRDGALLTFFGFSPAWQGRHGCGRGSPHGPAPPPALCRRRG